MISNESCEIQSFLLTYMNKSWETIQYMIRINNNLNDNRNLIMTDRLVYDTPLLPYL